MTHTQNMRKRSTDARSLIGPWIKRMRRNKDNRRKHFLFFTLCGLIPFALLSVWVYNRLLPTASIFDYRESYSDKGLGEAEVAKRPSKSSAQEPEFKFEYPHAQVLEKQRRSKILETAIRKKRAVIGVNCTTVPSVVDTATANIEGSATTSTLFEGSATTNTLLDVSATTDIFERSATTVLTVDITTAVPTTDDATTDTLLDVSATTDDIFEGSATTVLTVDITTAVPTTDNATTGTLLDMGSTTVELATTVSPLSDISATTEIDEGSATMSTLSDMDNTTLNATDETTNFVNLTTADLATTPVAVAISTRFNDTPTILVGAVLGFIIIVLIIFILVYFCCPCMCCFASACCRNRRDKYAVELVDASTEFSIPMEAFNTEAFRLSMGNEDLLKDAMEIGRVSVLEFAIKETRSAGPDSVDSILLAEAEKALNEWKRACFLLKDSCNNKDVEALSEYMKRFDELEIKDETGIYQQSADLQNRISQCTNGLHVAAEANDEQMIIAAISDFNAIGLSMDYMNSVSEFKEANDALSKIKQNHHLKGKSVEDLKVVLREAIEHRDQQKISAAIALIEEAEITTLDADVQDGHRVIEELKIEKKQMHDEWWQKLLDASQTRDAEALRKSLRCCSEYDVDLEQIREGEKLLKLVEREDQLLHEMRELIVLEDSAKLMEAIAVFRTPGLHLVDKTGDVERAEEVVQDLREKERMKRAKGDAMWRLQNARNVGDVVVMGGMIKALENLASMGEEIDEAVLLRAKAELETIRGRVDYRKQMEAIKSAIARMAKAENLSQLADLIEQMVELSSDENFTMTADDSRVLDESRGMLHDLRRKHAIIDEMEATKLLFDLPQIPNSLQKLTQGVQTMTRLKESAHEFEGVFGPADDDILTTASMNAEQLQAQVDEMNAALDKLHAASDSKNYNELIEAWKSAQNAPFMDEQQLKNAKDLIDFLNPTARADALHVAIKSRDIAELTLAIEDFNDANVTCHPVLLEKAERRLAKLIKMERKKKKAERKRHREEKRRRAAINELDRQLEVAMVARDRNQLQDALEKCENSGYEDKEIPLFVKAEELLDELTIAELRGGLLDAIQRRDIHILEHSIDQADYGGYVEELGDDYLCAKDLLFHLRELHQMREAISRMNRSLILEIQRYPTPPPQVHTVMTAALMMLGEKKANVTKWPDVQSLVGKLGDQSITRRVRRCAPGDITPELRAEVERVLEGLDINMVQETSKGAGAFYAWMQCMLKESQYVAQG